MIKICFPNISRQTIGGGFTFLNNIKKGIQAAQQAYIVNNPDDCNIYFITGAMMIDKYELEKVKKAGKKIIFRIDNWVKNSHNKGCGTSRMKKCAGLADVIIYQSEWARQYISPICGDGVVFYNGVDKNIFYPPKKPRTGKKYLFVQYNRDENKRAPEAFYDFYTKAKMDSDVELWIIGKFSPEIIKYNFDFFNGERIFYKEPLPHEKLAEIMRLCDYFYWPAYADASPNTLTEALACGCNPLLINPIGGSVEIYDRYKQGILPSIEDMTEEYLSLFKLLLSE